MGYPDGPLEVTGSRILSMGGDGGKLFGKVGRDELGVSKYFVGEGDGLVRRLVGTFS